MLLVCLIPKLDSRSLLRHKIIFARAYVRVDITEPLLEYAKIKRCGGKTCGYIIWYEDFFSSCSFCGCDEHCIDKYPLLSGPQREVKVCLLKNPKQKFLADTLSKAFTQESAGTWAEQANLVLTKPKSLGRRLPNSTYSDGKKFTTPVAKKSGGIIIKDSLESSAVRKLSTPTGHDLGSGKSNLLLLIKVSYMIVRLNLMMRMGALAKICPSNRAFQGSMLENEEVFAPSNVDLLSLVPLYVVYLDVFEGNQFAPLVGVEQRDPSLFDSDVENITLMLLVGPFMDELRSQPDGSFNSINSKSSIIKNIKALGVKHDTSLSSTSPPL